MASLSRRHLCDGIRLPVGFVRSATGNVARNFPTFERSSIAELDITWLALLAA
jgi:hypothetical protein